MRCGIPSSHRSETGVFENCCKEKKHISRIATCICANKKQMTASHYGSAYQ
ncbi:hypothetical protein Hanom_Chr04g00320601 [Helianthus anomalus]